VPRESRPAVSNKYTKGTANAFFFLEALGVGQREQEKTLKR
jgi:hypothetical protein